MKIFPIGYKRSFCLFMQISKIMDVFRVSLKEKNQKFDVDDYGVKLSKMALYGDEKDQGFVTRF